MYIVYAAIGNVVLKMFDYDIKQYILRENTIRLRYYLIAYGFSLIAVAATCYIIGNIYVIVIAIPLTGIFFLKRLIKNAAWD